MFSSSLFSTTRLALAASIVVKKSSKSSSSSKAAVLAKRMLKKAPAAVAAQPSSSLSSASVNRNTSKNANRSKISSSSSSTSTIISTSTKQSQSASSRALLDKRLGLLANSSSSLPKSSSKSKAVKNENSSKFVEEDDEDIQLVTEEHHLDIDPKRELLLEEEEKHFDGDDDGILRDKKYERSALSEKEIKSVSPKHKNNNRSNNSSKNDDLEKQEQEEMEEFQLKSPPQAPPKFQPNGRNGWKNRKGRHSSHSSSPSSEQQKQKQQEQQEEIIEEASSSFGSSRELNKQEMNQNNDRVNIDWDSSHLGIFHLNNPLSNTPFRLEQKEWAQPDVLVDVHGSPIIQHVYGHIIKELPIQSPMSFAIEEMPSDQSVRDEIRGRLTNFLSAVATTSRCPLSKCTEACAWWRLDAEDSPQRALMETAGQAQTRAKRAQEHLKEFLADDVYDMSSHGAFHSLLSKGNTGVPKEDKTAFAHAANLMTIAKRDAMALVAKQAGNREVVKKLLESTSKNRRMRHLQKRREEMRRKDIERAEKASPTSSSSFSSQFQQQRSVEDGM